MHEAGLAGRFVAAVLEEARNSGASRVTAVGAKIGELRGVVPRHLRSFFEAMAAGTPAEGARFVIDRVPASSVCPACGLRVDGPPHFRSCPGCGAGRLATAGGLEMELSWIEVE